MSGKYRKLFNHAKQSATNLKLFKTALKKKQFKKTTETACDLIGVKTANTITEVSNISQQNNLETVTNDNDK